MKSFSFYRPFSHTINHLFNKVVGGASCAAVKVSFYYSDGKNVLGMRAASWPDNCHKDAKHKTTGFGFAAVAVAVAVAVAAVAAAAASVVVVVVVAAAAAVGVVVAVCGGGGGMW